MTGKLIPLFVLAATLLPAAEAPNRLKIAVVQMAVAPTLSENCDRIVDWIPKAAAKGARLAVFPEGALTSEKGKGGAGVRDAVSAISAAARNSGIYVLYGGFTWTERAQKDANWMKVIAPDGRELLHYDKIWDVHKAANPAPFSVDGIPAGAIICADRWLRAVEELPILQGARISFELSNNFASEWVREFEWYWYIPRALRNNVYVVFTNNADPDPSQAHGHSAIIAPDGSLLAAARDHHETIVVADLDLSKATRAEALSRRSHPALAPFWDDGLALLDDRAADTPVLTPVESPDTTIRAGVAQVPDGDLVAVGKLVREAAGQKLDLVALPAYSGTTGQASELARRFHLTIAAREGETAFVIGPDGSVLTRHKQLSAGGRRLSTMWFRVKGVPAVVSVGKDALWNEIGELAAVAGARLHLNLSQAPTSDPPDRLRQRQIGAALSSFLTLTVMANTTYSAIFDDLSGMDETRAEVRGLARPDTGPVQVFSPFSANLAAEAGDGRELIVVERRIRGSNRYYPFRAAQFQPAMDAWYRFGGHLVLGDFQ